jgi:AcrR family transcriptional regulator
MDSLAAESGVTRQTVHNLFGTKTAVLEALFDEIALQGGMEHMPSVMQASDPEAMLAGFVKIFADFWASAPKLLRRVHGVAAIDPEFGRVVEARNRRRQLAATRVVDLCGRDDSRAGSSTKAQRVATLYALTSFEFFDALSGTSTDASIATEIILTLARNALGRDSLL